MKYWINISIIALLSVSCSEIRFGDDFLGDRPESSGADIDTMFNSGVNAEKVLAKAYTYLPYGIPTDGGGRKTDKLGYNTLESLTDLNNSFRANESDGPNNLYYNGGLSSMIASTFQGTEAYRFGYEQEYSAIRYAWIFIANVDRVPDWSDAKKRQKAAEAKMIVALSYSEMLRYMGGVPLLDHAVDVNEDFRYPRATFAETVDYIVKLLDEAAPHLSWKASPADDGRMTRAGAMALKVRVLLFAASPTFNSSQPWHPEADQYVCYGNYDRERYKKVIDACEDFFKELDASRSYGLVTAEVSDGMSADELHAARRRAFRSAYNDRGNSEILISTRRGTSATSLYKSFYDERMYSGPTLNYADMFPWADGEDFPENFNWESPSRAPFFDASGSPTRDPRLYETIVLPGMRYYNDTYAPLYINHLNYSSPSMGLAQMKFIFENSNERTQPVQWPYLRLPEVMLSYAEALNEYNGMAGSTAREQVNSVRSRVGLSAIPSSVGSEEFREIVLKERALEFGYEEVRWFDLIRWGRKADFCKPLYRLESKATDTRKPDTFTYKKVSLSNRSWAESWDTKWYLAPVPKTEIDMNYGMTQNPGW